jgi:hypothetical protein
LRVKYVPTAYMKPVTNIHKPRLSTPAPLLSYNVFTAQRTVNLVSGNVFINSHMPGTSVPRFHFTRSRLPI